MTKRAHIAIHDRDTGRREVPGRKFLHYIGGIGYWFTVHKTTPHGVDRKVSHMDSGMGVAEVGPTAQLACLGDEIGACRMVIDQLVARRGADYIRAVFDKAPPLPAYREPVGEPVTE